MSKNVFIPTAASHWTGWERAGVCGEFEVWLNVHELNGEALTDWKKGGKGPEVGTMRSRQQKKSRARGGKFNLCQTNFNSVFSSSLCVVKVIEIVAGGCGWGRNERERERRRKEWKRKWWEFRAEVTKKEREIMQMKTTNWGREQDVSRPKVKTKQLIEMTPQDQRSWAIALPPTLSEVIRRNAL
jgi:hypothetical protein